MDQVSQEALRVRRQKLRAINLEAWSSDPQASTASLDSSLKRNTAFIKRLRAGLAGTDGSAALLKEMAALRLDKYVSELAPAAYEGCAKCKTAQEIASAIEIISALHQRFVAAFSVPFIASLSDALAPPPKTGGQDKDEASRVTRQRTMLRLFGELEAVGIIKGKEGHGKAEGEELFELFKRLITADKANLGGNLPLVAAFCRHLGEIYLPSNAESLDDCIPGPQKDKFRTLIVAFFEALAKRAIKDRLHLLEADKRNHEAYIRSGEIFEDRAQAYEKATKTWEKEWSGLQTLAEYLGDSVTMPALPELPTQVISSANVTLHSESASDSMDKWMDEEERLFYEELPDLRDHLPPDMIGGHALITSVEAEVQKVDVLTEGEGGREDEEEPAVGQTASPLLNGDDAGAPPARIDTLLVQLPTLTSKEACDRLAIDLSLQLRDKGNRKRAIRALIDAPKQAQAVLAFYARIIAILSQVFPDIAAGVLTEVGRVRMRTAIYLSELTKFGVTPSHVIFHVYQVCASDLNGINVDHFCALLEGCGRYLLRTPSTREKMQHLLDVAKRKRAAQNLDARYNSMLDNAFVQADPPERVALPPKVRTHTTLFVNHLIYDLLSRSTIDKVLKSLRKLHWEQAETRRKLLNAFGKPWKIRSSHLQLLALLLHDLKVHTDFQIEVVDAVLERIREGLETNRYKHNQRRVADIKYLGELYNFRLVPQRVVFDTLWMLMTFAHPDGRPRPEMPSILDAPDDFFRARLLCVLLETCCANLDKGPDAKKVEHVLVFFDLYLFCKQRPPMDVEYMVQDTFDTLRPKHKRPGNFAEAVNAVDDMLSVVANETGPLADEDATEEMDVADDRTYTLHGAEEDGADGGEDDIIIDEPAPESTDEALTVAPRKPTMTEQDQEDFEREFQAMMTTSNVDRSRLTGKPARFDVGLPMGKREVQPRVGTADHTVFTMLARRGGKPATRSVEVPNEVSMALSSRTRALEDEKEKQKMKRLVLSLAE